MLHATTNHAERALLPPLLFLRVNIVYLVCGVPGSETDAL